MHPPPLRIVFAGTPDFAVPTLQALIDSPHEIVAVYTQPDRPAGRGRQARQSPVKQLAVNSDLLIMQPESLKTDEALRQLQQYQADIMIVVAYGQILPSALLQTPRYGCLNVHASLLPRWRGAAPIHRSLLAGDKETGVTIMQMDEGLDTGDMLATVKVDIQPDDTSGVLHDQLAVKGAEALLRVVNDIADGRAPAPVRQDESQACYAHKLDKSEASIDWQQPADVVLRAIKAFNPWPVAFTDFQGKPLRVWDAALGENEQQENSPGAVMSTEDNQIVVACASGNIVLREVQPAGKKRMSAEAFLNARRDVVKAGFTFG